MKAVYMAEFSDLLRHAEILGFFWNNAHDILVKDEVPPMHGDSNIEYYKSDITSNQYGWSADSVRIVQSYMELNDVTKFTLIA
jgi:hypothetical protein